MHTLVRLGVAEVVTAALAGICQLLSVESGLGTSVIAGPLIIMAVLVWPSVLVGASGGSVATGSR